MSDICASLENKGIFLLKTDEVVYFKHKSSLRKNINRKQIELLSICRKIKQNKINKTVKVKNNETILNPNFELTTFIIKFIITMNSCWIVSIA